MIATRTLWWISTLAMVAAGTALAVRAASGRRPGSDSDARDARIDQELEESFPASDPPSWTPSLATTTTEG